MGTIPTPRHPFWAEKQFGRGVGPILAAIGGWLTWRGGFTPVTSVVLGGGVLLLVLAIVSPRLLVWPNRGWMRLAEGLSFLSTRLVLGIVFFLAVTPIGTFKRLTGWDPLGRRRQPQESYWTPYPERVQDATHFEKMF